MRANESPTATDGQQLTSKQEQLIALLVAGVAIVTAAKNVSVSEATAHRWLKLPHFQQAYRNAQRLLFGQALAGLLLKVDKAIETLDRNMNGEEVLPATQVRAAQIILEKCIEIYKMSELEERLLELEQVVKRD